MKRNTEILWQKLCINETIETFFLCTPVLFDKESEHGYITFCEKTMQEQIAAFDQQLGVIHELDSLIPYENGNIKVKVKLVPLQKL